MNPYKSLTSLAQPSESVDFGSIVSLRKKILSRQALLGQGQKTPTELYEEVALSLRVPCGFPAGSLRVTGHSWINPPWLQ